MSGEGVNESTKSLRFRSEKRNRLGEAGGERDFFEISNASSAERSPADSRAAKPRDDGATASRQCGGGAV
ncbi:hypothetical protein [Haladaptatus cibarius]|uniref:hypothetical protein n=1 Tax=Haladaptatus cibarius TaxID=453847 RepID=UPI000AEA0BFE|nr:hypothetical protein [Haladaptatus cibarius]